MKFLKLLFSKTPILLAALFLQLAMLVFVLVRYSEYFVWFEAISIVLGLLIFLHMLGRDTAAEFKLPWIFILMALPLLGAVLYLFLANPRIKRRQNRALEGLEAVREEYLVASGEYRSALIGTLGDYSGIERHLSTSVRSHGFLNNRIAYYGDGMAFFDALCSELETAQSFIFLEYFIISEGLLYNRIHEILRRKVTEGVEVRILYDDLGTLGKLPSGFAKRLCNEGINCRKFNKVYPILSGIYNYRDHRKIAVIDGRVGFTGGMNIGDEYAGLDFPFGRWKDSAVRIEGAAVGNLTHLFFQLWDSAGKREESFEKSVPLVTTLAEAEPYRSLVADEKRFYDKLSQREKLQLSQSYVEKLISMTELLSECRYETPDGVTVEMGGSAISGEEIASGAKDSFTVNVTFTDAWEKSADGINNEQDHITSILLDFAEGKETVKYYDITMTKEINGEKIQITDVYKNTDTYGKFLLTIPIPDEYKGQASYSIVHVHLGNIVTLADLDDNPDTITVEVDKFSAFVLVADENSLTEEASDEGSRPGSNAGQDGHECDREYSGWAKFWNAVANFFRKLFGLPEKCVCGYKEDF